MSHLSSKGLGRRSEEETQASLGGQVFRPTPRLSQARTWLLYKVSLKLSELYHTMSLAYLGPGEIQSINCY